MRSVIIAIAIFTLFLVPAMAQEGMVLIRSKYTVDQTAKHLESAIVQNKNLTLFQEIDHAENARKMGMTLRPTRVFLFGNPELGTPLMKCRQSVGIDLPQKILIWQDADGQTWVGYNDPVYFAERHEIIGCDQVLLKVDNALSGLARKAAGLEEQQKP